MTTLLTIIVLLATLVAGGLYMLREPDRDEGPTYSQAEVRRGDIEAPVSATGALSPMKTVQVGSQVSDTIQRLYVDFNDRVKRGQIIAQIDPAIVKARRAEAAANLKSAQAARDKAWVSVTPASVLIAILFAGLVGVFFGLHPARKASRLRPIEAMR